MRIDFAENYVGFADYPDFKNVNVNCQESKFYNLKKSMF